jgi:DNA-binding SARP family transcriptional activator
MTQREWPAEPAVERAPIRLQTLGAVDLCDHEGRALQAVLAQPRRLGLLVYLAMASRFGVVRRDQAIGVFWPDYDAEHARAALNRAIYYLRQSLGEGVLISRGDDEIAVAADHLWCDAVALETAVSHGQHERALELYRGELLEGFFVSRAPGFERWLEAERQRIGDVASRSASSLADAAERAGKHAVAAQWYRWAVDRSPLDEVAVQRLMGALDRAGDRAGSVLAYERFARRIAGDLDLSPAPETQALLDAIRVRGTVVSYARAASDKEGHATSGEKPTASAHAEVRAEPALFNPGRAGRRSRRGAIGGAVVFAVAVSVAFVALRGSRPLDPRRIAVASMRPSSGDRSLDSLAERGNTAIRDALAQTGLLAVVVQPSSRDDGGVHDVRALGRETGAGSIVLTSSRRDGDTLYFDAWITEPLGGSVRWVVPAVPAVAASMGSVTRETAQRVAAAIVALADRRFASWLPNVTAPPTLRAYEEFDRAFELKLRNRPAEALPHFVRAAALDATFTWAQLEAAIVYMNVGDRIAADSIVDVLARSRERLSVAQRHWLDWMLALRDEDLTRSFAALERAAALAPDRFLYTLAENARWLNRPRQSLALLERLGPDNALGVGFGYWYLMADSYHQLGEHARELDVARRARVRFPNRPTAIIIEARARAALGDVPGTLALVDASLAAPRDGRDSPGTMMLQTAEELRAHGHAAASAQLLERAITWFEARPQSEAASMEMRRQLAKATYDAGRWTDADSLFRQLLADDRDGVAYHRANLGAIAAHRRDTTEARRFLRILQDLTWSVSRPREDAMLGQARILAVLGNVPESIRLLREALGGQGQDLHTDLDFTALAGDPAFRLFVKPKG